MKAIIMAAGMGRRMNGCPVPKSTLDVNGKSIIRNSVEMLLESGIDVAVVIGYEGDQIKKDLEGLKVSFFRNPFYKITNSMASLWFATPFMECGEDTLLIDGDLYWERPMLNAILEPDDRDIVALGDDARGLNGDYVYHTVDGIIREHGKSLPPEKRNSECVGVMRVLGRSVCTVRDALDTLMKEERFDTFWVQSICDFTGIPVHVKDVGRYFWGEVDCEEDYQRIQDHFKRTASHPD